MEPEEELLHLRRENQILREQLAKRDELITQLQERLSRLEERVAKDSHNSSLPPSSDRFARQPRSLRKASGKKPGGQAGHKGEALSFSRTPDEMVLHPLRYCSHCQGDLSGVLAVIGERRQVIDVPAFSARVSEHQVEEKRCPHCQKKTRACFPAEVKAPVQYGSRIGAIAVYLVQQHLLPLGRACEILSDLLGCSMSQATVSALIERTAAQLEPIERLTKTALSLEAVLHQDETGLYVAGKRQWLHVSATATLTHYAVHPSRGKQALQEIGILPAFCGISMHDGWQSYWQYDCGHALCNVHHLRELVFVAEELHQSWAASMQDLLLSMKAQVQDAKASQQSSLPTALVQRLTGCYATILLQGYLENLPTLLTRSTSPPKPGRKAQGTALNLLDRLCLHQDAVLAFLYDFAVPFDNSQAERDIRMVKVQQKVSGCFRSHQGACCFARIRGYLSTLRKQGLPLLAALHDTLLGHPLLPSF
jgi:transposase